MDGKQKKCPFACPDCGGPLKLECEGVIRYSVNPKTGAIGMRPTIYDPWNPMGPSNLYCDKCSKGFGYWHDDGKAFVIGIDASDE